ncbi:hypothetical protein DL546_007905 [Coniochaeta pulveracea]|uniref:Glutamine amidotransferase domain-containing protein n=1 Tax=Coniochaeta pulveracea TaxID=177199 RepID=A0A420YH43_9PEZI|nr:hypothetical protein DL546_007905 [Coniochaeta pulveracea]
MGSQPTPSPLRLLIIEADNPTAPSASAGYGQIFIDLLAKAATPTPISSLFAIQTINVVYPNAPSYPEPSSLDAVLISGSKYNAFEDGEGNWIANLAEFTRRCLEQDRTVKVIGVCFGHQIIGRALGVPVTRSPNGWEISVTPMRLTPAGRKIFGDRETLRIHQMHQDVVSGLPAGAEGLAESDSGQITREIMDARRAAGIWEQETYEDGLRRVDDEHDGVEIARAFLRFLRE